MTQINNAAFLKQAIWTPPANLTGAGRIAAINDRFRQTFGDAVGSIVPGRVVITCGIAALSPLLQLSIIRRIRYFDHVPRVDDPNGEHDFGAFTIAGMEETIFWKIDVYADDALEWGAEDPGDLEAIFPASIDALGIE